MIATALCSAASLLKVEMDPVATEGQKVSARGSRTWQYCSCVTVKPIQLHNFVLVAAARHLLAQGCSSIPQHPQQQSRKAIIAQQRKQGATRELPAVAKSVLKVIESLPNHVVLVQLSRLLKDSMKTRTSKR